LLDFDEFLAGHQARIENLLLISIVW